MAKSPYKEVILEKLRLIHAEEQMLSEILKEIELKQQKENKKGEK